MKNWFISLESKKKRNLLIIAWAVTALLLIMTHFALMCWILFFEGLVVSILFTVWFCKKAPAVEEVNENRPEDGTAETPVQDEAE